MAPLLETPIVQPPGSYLQDDGSVDELLTVLSSENVIIGGSCSPATLVVSPMSGKILRIYPQIVPSSEFPDGTLYTDYTPKVIMPGLVDAHVHLNEPGFRTEWEGFNTGTRAAAFGGVTTLIDMPLNAVPPTTTVENFEKKINAAEGQCWVDVGFYGGVIPGNQNELVPLVRAGVKGFKCFMIESGVEEFPCVEQDDVAKAMNKLKDCATVLMFHAEMLPPLAISVGDAITTGEPPLCPTGPLNAYKTFLESRPPAFETYAVEAILSCAPIAPDLPLHIVHLSSAECLPIVRRARKSGVKLTAETCFHYLTLAAEDVQDGDTRHKCCPPIREGSNRDQLWEALRDGTIETVVSDHSPCTPNLKLLPRHGGSGDFFEAWGGVSTVGLGLSILWTAGRRRGLSLAKISELTSYNTAKQVGLLGSKGALAEGWDADICIFDPERQFKVSTEDMKFRNKLTPYEEKVLHGRVCETWLRGHKVYSFDQGGFDEKRGPTGILLLERRAHPN